MDRITGSGCDVCRGAVPSGKESSGHTGLCAQVLADALAAERARAHDAINQLDKETAYSGVTKAALDLVALVLHPDKSPDEAWTYSTGDLPVMARDLRARAERAEAERDDLRCLLRAREEWIHGRLGDGCPHSGCPQCDAAFPAEAFGLAPGFGYSLIDAARKLASERDVAQAKVAEQARYLLADEERRKLTGDALYAEGKLADAENRILAYEEILETRREHARLADERLSEVERERDRLRERVRLAEAWLEADDEWRARCCCAEPPRFTLAVARKAFRASKGGE